MHNKTFDQPLREIRERVEAIRNVSDDIELAHSLEDNLYLDFIKYIAGVGGTAIQNELAQEVLKTKKIKFKRATGDYRRS